MDIVHLPVINVMGTLIALLVYTYLYYVGRDRYIGLWAAAWFIFLLRNICFDLGFFSWQKSTLGFLIYQLLFISSALTLLWGIQLFIKTPLKKYWVVSALGASMLSTAAILSGLPLAYALLPPAWFGGILCMWIGKIYLDHFELRGVGIVGRYVTGTAFLLWGIVTMLFPFFLPHYKLFSLVGGILRLIIGPGTLIIFYEQNRLDLMNKYRLLTQNAVDVIYRIRLVPEQRFEYISPAVRDVTGYAAEEYYENEKLLFSLIHPEDVPIFDQSTHIGTLLVPVRLIRRDQTVIWVEHSRIAIYDNKNKMVAVEGIIRDITMRHELEQMVAQAERMNMVGQMAVSVAHEIRNPLTTIRGYMQLLESKEPSEFHKERYNLIIEELDRTNEIISEYLMLSRDKAVMLRNCCLNRVIRTLHPLMQAAAAASSVDIKTDLQQIPDLYLDENEIRQLILNLVRNAIEAMPSGGEIVIGTFVEQNRIGLSICDQGPGIQPFVYDQLGTPFITTKENGTGLGLPICYQIACRHNATIDVETSEQGTTFIVYFQKSK